MPHAKGRERRGIIEERRVVVARLWARGLSLPEVTAALQADGRVNPKTRQPWSQSQVYRDTLALQKAWRAVAVDAIVAGRARQLAEIAEVKRQAWAVQDLHAVLAALRHEAKILGLEAPTQIGGDPENPLVVEHVLTWMDGAGDEDRDATAG